MSEETIEPSVQEETQEATGLLDNATPEVEEASSDNPQQVEIDHRDPKELQALEDAENPIPDWWPENFIKDDKRDEQALVKSWKDLRKQISQGKHKAPEDGKYDVAAFGNTPEDDPVRGHVLEWAKENNISQGALDSLVSNIVDMASQEQETYEINLDEERKALGPNADARINGMAKWAGNLVQKGIWTKDDFEEFKIMGGTARGISALEKLRASYEGRVPLETTIDGDMPTKEEIYSMVGDERYKTDSAFRQKVERYFAQVFA
jgi:hypothetical protein